MYRSLVTIVAVAAISCFLVKLQHAQGQLPDWVRTADGWEPSGVLLVESRPLETPELHPLLVASFQLGASVFVLLAFPGSKPTAQRISPRASSLRSRKRAGRQFNPQWNA